MSSLYESERVILICYKVEEPIMILARLEWDYMTLL